MRLGYIGKVTFGSSSSDKSFEELNDERYAIADKQGAWQQPVKRQDSADSGLDVYVGKRGGRSETRKEGARSTRNRNALAEALTFKPAVR